MFAILRISGQLHVKVTHEGGRQPLCLRQYHEHERLLEAGGQPGLERDIGVWPSVKQSTKSEPATSRCKFLISKEWVGSLS